ncbi:hypothetical protein HYU13_05980 [Candidatus Woesearchaeota archaeon]|nr:hypothetical protein [Candidatus Woesearchaeota archaeon]
MVRKIHTRFKRYHKISTHTNPYNSLHGQKKPNRPRTFKTEEAARKYAKTEGIEGFTLKKVKKGKKFQIVQK